MSNAIESTPAAEPVLAEQRAPFGRRLGALVIDCALSAGVAALFTAPDPPRLASAAVMVVAYSFFVGFFQQTPGMRLFRLACVKYPGGGPIGIPRAVVRTALLQLLIPAVFLDARGRGWHDKVAGSIIVEVTSRARE